MNDYFAHEARLKTGGFYPILHSLPKGYRVTCPTMKLKKIPEGFGPDPVAALLACEAELQTLLTKPEWRHVA